MKIYEIAMFIFIVNMVLGMLNLMDFTSEFATPLSRETIVTPSAGEEKISRTVGEEQSGIRATLNWLTENVYLAIQGMGAFISIFLNSTIFSYNTYFKFLCYGGVDCSMGSLMWSFASGLSALTYFVYTVGLIQLATGKSFPTME